VDQSQTSFGVSPDEYIVVSDEQLVAQTFTAGFTGSLCEISVPIRKVAGYSCEYLPVLPGDLIVQIRSTQSATVDVYGGNYGQTTAWAPTDVVLATETVSESTITGVVGWINVSFSSPAQVTRGTRYALFLTAVGVPLDGSCWPPWAGAYVWSTARGPNGSDLYVAGQMLAINGNLPRWSVFDLPSYPVFEETLFEVTVTASTPTVTVTSTSTSTPTPAETATATATPVATPTAVESTSPSPAATPACGATPQTECRTPSRTGSAALLIKAGTSAEKNLLVWKWTKGPATTKADFGDPTTTDTYRLCIYDGASQLISSATAPAGGVCNASTATPCWSESTTGFSYRDKDRTPDGIQTLVLREGLVGAARIVLRARGAHLGAPTRFPVVQPVTMQLENGRTCWQATYSSPALRNTASPSRQFKDKAD
jgi:hypothetical protein